jgi:pimeloyl-ACP methyl ester carboxylesterase
MFLNGLSTSLYRRAAHAAAAAGLALSAVASVPVTGSADEDHGCAGDPTQVYSTSPLLGISGRFALPASDPHNLVVFAHGYRNNSSSWEGHIKEAAAHGILAVAPDYRGLGAAPDFRGWPAKAGSEDIVTIARFVTAHCPGIKNVIVLGVSMGGNMSGLAVAAKATRADGKTPLFDYWIDVEGATNWTETYLEASAVGPTGNAYAVGAAQDISAEAGGTPATAPSGFQSRTVVARAQDIAASGLKGVVMIHSVEDGLVPYNQSRETATALRALQVPLDFYSVLRRTADRDPGHEQTTLLGNVPGGQDADPFAGHAWEGSSTHVVMKTAMSRLYDLFDASKPRPARGEFVVDGNSQVPVPALPAASQRASAGVSAAAPSALPGGRRAEPRPRRVREL